MKTTIDIADALLEETRKLASQRGTSVRALVEASLRRLLDEHKAQPEFQLRKASFRGEGLQEGMDASDWDRMRELAYEGRGA